MPEPTEDTTTAKTIICIRKANLKPVIYSSNVISNLKAKSTSPFTVHGTIGMLCGTVWRCRNLNKSVNKGLSLHALPP